MDEFFVAKADRALETLRRIVAENPRCGYRIGRCAAADLSRLFTRGENAAACLFRVLGRGSRTESDLLERILDRRGRAELTGAWPLPRTPLSPVPDSDSQVVYVIVLEPRFPVRPCRVA